MKLIINHSSMQPIYEQIVEQIKGKIMQGELKEKYCTSFGEIIGERVKSQCSDGEKSLRCSDGGRIYYYNSWKRKFCRICQSECHAGREKKRSGGGL